MTAAVTATSASTAAMNISDAKAATSADICGWEVHITGYICLKIPHLTSSIHFIYPSLTRDMHCMNNMQYPFRGFRVGCGLDYPGPRNREQGQCEGRRHDGHYEEGNNSGSSNMDGSNSHTSHLAIDM